MPTTTKLIKTVRWEAPAGANTFLILWDIDREFQNVFDAYEDFQARNRHRRPIWACFSGSRNGDSLSRSLGLGRQVQRVMDQGKEMFGTHFERGDSKCHAVLSAQLLRLQCEIKRPLYDTTRSSHEIAIPHEELIRTAQGIRRTCLIALLEQLARFESRTTLPVLPPPRFKVEYCPFASQVRHYAKQNKRQPGTFVTPQVNPKNPHDDREICPHCDAVLSVAAHSGLSDYRATLFMSHVALPSTATSSAATFVCDCCYKSFEDSYAFLEHMYQMRIDGEDSCRRRTRSGRWVVKENEEDNAVVADPELLEQCLRNCLMRELKRARTLKQTQQEREKEKLVEQKRLRVRN